MSDDTIEIFVCACGFNEELCGHKQEAGGCRLDDDDHDPGEDDGDHASALASVYGPED